jgi:hypothetical protein
MDMLTTNAVLGGVTLVVAVSKIAACIWLVRAVCQRVSKVRDDHRRSWSHLRIIMYYPAIRMMAGAATTFFGAFWIFFLRIPLRGAREGGDSELGTAWLDASVWWEVPAMVLVVTGMAMIMWPAFDKYTTRLKTVGILAATTLAVFLIGALSVQYFSIPILKALGENVHDDASTDRRKGGGVAEGSGSPSQDEGQHLEPATAG